MNTLKAEKRSTDCECPLYRKYEKNAQIRAEKKLIFG